MQNETTRHKGKQEERQTGRQYRRQDLGKADKPSNNKADTLRKLTPTVHCLKKCKIRPPTTKGNKKKDKLGDKLGDMKEDKLGDKGDKTSGRRTHHPTQAKKRETMGDKGETRPRESGRTIQHRSHVGRQWETNGDKTSGRRAQHPTQAHVWGDNGRQGLLKADMIQGGDTIQHRHQCGELMGDKGQTRLEDNWGDNGRQWETRGDKTSRRRTHHPIQAHISRDTWRQPETRIDKKGDKGGQDLGRADTPSNTGTNVGTMGGNSETRRREGGHTISREYGRQ